MIIAFGGKRGVGKTTAANYLVRNYGFKKSSFANLLREQVTAIFGFKSTDFNEANKEKPYKNNEWSPRDVMRKYGEFMRYWTPDYWIKNIDLDGDNVVIDDMRYENEATYLKKKKATLVRMNRYAKDVPYKTVINDASETQLDDYEHDHIIHEFYNADMKQLHDSLDSLMDDLGYTKRTIRRETQSFSD